MKEHEIHNYCINRENTIDVNGNVRIEYKGLKEIPVQFGSINGNFWCHNNLLTSLKGCPRYVRDIFHCGSNQLTSLEYCPKVIEGNFECSFNHLNTLYPYITDIRYRELFPNGNCDNVNREARQLRKFIKL